MDHKIEQYKKILKKYGIVLCKEELFEMAQSIDQLAECFLDFERKKRVKESAKQSISEEQYPNTTMQFLRVEDVVSIFH